MAEKLSGVCYRNNKTPKQFRKEVSVLLSKKMFSVYLIEYRP